MEKTPRAHSKENKDPTVTEYRSEHAPRLRPGRHRADTTYSRIIDWIRRIFTVEEQ